MRLISGTQEPQTVPHFSLSFNASRSAPAAIARRISSSPTSRQLQITLRGAAAAEGVGGAGQTSTRRRSCSRSAPFLRSAMSRVNAVGCRTRGALNVMRLHSPQSAVLSAVVFNALIIVGLIPLALRGVKYRPAPAARLLRNNLLVYGLGGLILPFPCIKGIDLLLQWMGV